MALPANRADTVSFVSLPGAGPVQATPATRTGTAARTQRSTGSSASPAASSRGATDSATGRAARLWALLERIDAALASLAAIVWSELLCALAVAGQCAAGARTFPPDLLDEDGNPSRPPSTELTELHPDRQ